MTTLIMKLQEYRMQRIEEPIDKPTLIFALAAFGGVSLYGFSALAMILTHAFSLM